MFIRFESSVAGTNFAYHPGDVVEWPDDEESRRMIERGIAEQLLDRNAANAAAASSGRPVRTHRGTRAEKATKMPAEAAVR